MIDCWDVFINFYSPILGWRVRPDGQKRIWNTSTDNERLSNTLKVSKGLWKKNKIMTFSEIQRFHLYRLPTYILNFWLPMFRCSPIFVDCCGNIIWQSSTDGAQCIKLTLLLLPPNVSTLFLLAGLSEKGRLELRRWCCQGPRGVVAPQMDFITCQRGSRIKRVALNSPPPLLSSKQNIWEKGNRSLC